MALVVEPGRVVLASGSPRRRELLSTLGLTFVVDAADIDETEFVAEDPTLYVVRLARTKAAHVAARHEHGTIVIAADTTVELDGSILGKPTDPVHAGSMLAALSGRTHRVHTGMAVMVAGAVGEPWVNLSTTDVTFRSLDDATIERYLATGEPMDKAGAYAIQGVGGALVSRISGNVQNVIGLPLADLLANPLVDAMVRAVGVTPVI